MSNPVRLTLIELESYRNQHEGKPSGQHLRYYCPIHKGDHQRSLSIDPATGRFQCFTCGAWGYIKENSLPCPHKSQEQIQQKPLDLAVILSYLQKALPVSPGEEYLRQRGISLELAQEYGIGYAANGLWPHLKNGLPIRQWTWGRVVFPHTNPDGEIVNLYGRAVNKGGEIPKELKHDHLPGAKGVFNAKALGYEVVFICESPFNALSLITTGCKNACAIFGLLGLRWDWIMAKKIVFCFDKDSSGLKQQQELAWEGVTRGFEVFFISPEIYGTYKDLNEVFITTGKLNLGDWQSYLLTQDPPKLSDCSVQNWRQELASWPKEFVEDWYERVGICQFDGGINQEDAERLAFEDIKRKLENQGISGSGELQNLEIQTDELISINEPIMSSEPNILKSSDPSFFPISQNVSTSPETILAQKLLHQEGINIEYITEPKQAITVIDLLVKGKIIGLDIETAKLAPFEAYQQAGLDPHLSRIRLIQIFPGGNTVYVFDLNRIPLSSLAPLWDRPLVAHNAVFELKHLLYAGVSPNKVGCTMLQANALYGTLPSLAELAKELLGWHISKELQTSNWNAPQLSQEQIAYAALDATVVYKIHHCQIEALVKMGKTKVYTIMRDAQHAIAKLEINGCYFDWEGHTRLLEEWTKTKKSSEHELLQILGTNISLESTKQLSDWLQANLDKKTLAIWPRTETGQLSTELHVLGQVANYPLVEPLRKYKESTKRLVTFGTNYIAHINPKTKRIHANFRLGGTSTGRMSCSSPNIQNPPRDKAFRALFSAPPGYVLVVGDYSQIELRVAAFLSGDKAMLEAYERGEDIHRKTASAITGIPLDQITKEQRQAAKAVNFGLLYGQGAKGLAWYAKTNYGVAMSLEEAKKAREAFFRAYQGLHQWQRNTAYLAQRTFKVTTLSGRIRDFSKEHEGYHYAEFLNTPIQGTAAEIFMISLARLDHYLIGMDAKLINVVHDECILEVKEPDIDKAKEALEKAMIEGMLSVFPNACIKNLVEMHIGRNWAEAK